MNFKENEQMEAEQAETNTQKEQRGSVKKSTAAIIVLLLLLLIVGVILMILLLNRTPDGVVLDPNSGKFEAPMEVSEETDSEYIRIPALTTIYVAEGSDTAKAILWNPDSNPCYFQYSIVLTDTEEIIYESGMIAPGNAVQEVTFHRTFTEGVYPITIRISSFDLNDPKQPMNGGEIKAKLVAVVE